MNSKKLLFEAIERFRVELFAPEEPWPVFSRAFRCHFERTLVLMGRSIRVADEISFSNVCNDILEQTLLMSETQFSISSVAFQQSIKKCMDIGNKNKWGQELIKIVLYNKISF
jgi:hypothetical protein